MAAADLVQLIDLALGSQPCGVVNFNYLHGLLHEIVKRLVHVERDQSAGGSAAEPVDLRPTDSSPIQPQDGAVTAKQVGTSVAEEEGRRGEGETKRESPASAGGTPIHPSSSALGPSGSQLLGRRSRPSIVTAANDLSALERKLQELELKIDTMQSLPDMLERKSSDSQATPVHDMWNFTILSKRLSATEDGLDKTSRLVDELLGEVQGLRSQVTTINGSMGGMADKLSAASGDITTLEEKLNALEALKLAAAQDSMGDAASALLAELQGKIDAVQKETKSMKQTMDALDPTAYVSSSQLEEALGKALRQQEEAMKRQTEGLLACERSLQESSETLGALDSKVGAINEDLDKLAEQMKEAESSLAQKVNTSDLVSLMPQSSSDEGASFMPKLIELQNKLAQIEAQLGRQPALPPDVLDQITLMQKAIDSLSAEMSSLSSLVTSGGEDRGRLDDLGSQVAQLRERLAELDRAVTALTNTVSSVRLGAQVEEEEGANYVSSDSFEALQSALGQMQQEHERLIGTAAHLSHEQEVNTEHIKSLYSAVDDLRGTKADKEQLEIEVQEKADRTALEGKASREWVDSTFERLDREIREAKSKLLGQEEAFRSAVTQLTDDVEGKLDRLELEPLKAYFDKKLERAKTAPITVKKEEAIVDDAAGFRKPLHFRCISCDKPVGIKPLSAIPALPSISTFPGTRSFRPYTTYELEVIRRHQRLGYPLIIPSDVSRSVRSAGGTHTLTRPHQKIRVAPLSSVCTSEAPSRMSPTIHDELDIIGQDGHIYKGRSNMPRGKLPPIGRSRRGDYGQTSHPSRPSTSPFQQPVTS